MKADGIMTVEEIAGVRNAHKAMLEEKLAAVPSFEPAVPTPNDEWRTMVWPGSEEAMKHPDTGVSETILSDVGKASVTISSEGFVRSHIPVNSSTILTQSLPRKSTLA